MAGVLAKTMDHECKKTMRRCEGSAESTLRVAEDGNDKEGFDDDDDDDNDDHDDDDDDDDDDDCIDDSEEAEEKTRRQWEKHPPTWPFPSAEDNHPKIPVWDPRNEFPGVPWIGLLLGITTFFHRKL